MSVDLWKKKYLCIESSIKIVPLQKMKFRITILDNQLYSVNLACVQIIIMLGMIKCGLKRSNEESSVLKSCSAIDCFIHKVFELAANYH